MGKSYRTIRRKVYSAYYHRNLIFTPHGDIYKEFVLEPESAKSHTDTNEHHTHGSDKSKKYKTPKNLWALKITIITLVIAALFRYLADVATAGSDIFVAILIILVFIIIGIITDGIAVAVTSCDIAPLSAMASRRVPGSKAALNLVRNADKVANICADVVGDICGIISGACSAVVVAKILMSAPGTSEVILTIGLSSLIAALTVGGKAFVKSFAMKYSKEFVLITAKFVSLFKKEK